MSAQLPNAPTGELPSIDRRAFIGTGAAVCAASLLPLSTILAASPGSVASTQAGALSDWTIDDMWGVYPRYADAIGYSRPSSDSVVVINAVDAGLVA
jgi:hypothetical protein